MSDELVSALLKDAGLRVVVATAGGVARQARALHQAEPAAAALFAQGLSAASLLAALQKHRSRINLQLECDGPLRGFFVDADGGAGSVRGYVKNPAVQFTGAEGQWRWRPVLGNRGFLSVMRDLGGGEFYRSAVELQHFDFALDLERYFEASEQLPTQVALEVGTAPVDGKPDVLGCVAGAFLQPLPDGDRELFAELGGRLRADFARALAAHPGEGALALLKALVGRDDLEVMSRYPLVWQCTCGKERVRGALLSLGRAELEDILRKERQAEVTCQFCTARYVVSEAEIRELLEQPPAG